MALADHAGDLLGLAMALTVVAVAVMAIRFRRRQGSLGHARERGLSRSSALFLAHALGSERPVTVRALLDAPELLREKLAARLGHLHRRETAERFSLGAARLLDELGVRAPRFEHAPLLFERVRLEDRSRPGGQVVTAFVADVDEHTVTFITPHACPWTRPTDLFVDFPERAHPAGFEARLRCPPPAGDPEWVLDHGFRIEDADRRLAPRVPCDDEVWLLRPSVEVTAVRAELTDPAGPAATHLEHTDGWVARRRAQLVDLSTHGAGLLVHHEVEPGHRFHLALHARDRLVALPLCEVVHVTPRPDGRLRLGARFYGVRLAERMRLADLVRRLSKRGGHGLRTTTIKRAAGLRVEPD